MHVLLASARAPLSVLLILGLCWGTTGCDEPGSVGIGLIDEPETVFSTDTLTVQTATVYMDSVATQGGPVLLTGAYRDPLLGHVRAQGYAQLALGTAPLVIGEDAVYDSLTLHLRLGYVYGASDEPQSIAVHRVLEPIEPDDDETTLYNSDAFAYTPEALGQGRIQPDEDTELTIRLSDTLGRTLFDAAQEGDDIATDNERFREVLEGVVLVGDTQNTAVTGFEIATGDSSAFSLRLYYTDGNQPTSPQRQYAFGVSAAYFSQVQSERPAPLDQLTDTRASLSSARTDAQTFVQGSIGLMTRYTFPTLTSLLYLSSYTDVIRADLYVFPIAHTYPPDTPLAQPLLLYVADEQNRIQSILELSEEGGEQVRPVVDDEFNRSTYYRFNVTPFVESELEAGYDTERGLLLAVTPTANAGSVDRVVLGGSDHEQYRAVLQVVYVLP